MEYQMITKIVSKIQKDKRPNATSVFKLFSLFMVRWQWHGQVNQLPCPSEGKQSKSKHLQLELGPIGSRLQLGRYFVPRGSIH